MKMKIGGKVAEIEWDEHIPPNVFKKFIPGRVTSKVLKQVAVRELSI